MALLAFLLSGFIKNKKVVLLVIGIIVLGMVVLFDQSKYTTFSELYESKLKQDTEVESMTLTINQPSDDNPTLPDRTAFIKIEDQTIIDQIINDLSKAELKREDDEAFFRKYELRFVVTNKVKEEHYRSEFLHISLDDQYLSRYKIVNEANHLQTIESLVENNELDWEYITE